MFFFSCRKNESLSLEFQADSCFSLLAIKIFKLIIRIGRDERKKCKIGIKGLIN